MVDSCSGRWYHMVHDDYVRFQLSEILLFLQLQQIFFFRVLIYKLRFVD